MKVNNANNTKFEAIKYTCVLPPTAGSILDKSTTKRLDSYMVITEPSIRLKNIIEKSSFFNNLATNTDVYIGNHCSNETSKNPFWVFAATFSNPNNPTIKTANELLFIGHAKDKDNWFSKLESFVKELPEKYEDIKKKSITNGFIFTRNN